ncbi:hypothetical protein E2C01_014051 [Portunus trituberculatus]|uniref:Uncharacterized protein n=1 Tax=Portunus trituberculatus TaxID=210409 RepID=A0A5B7DI49_PORTR|nr:hypothetical protein [Portunus trituberculatus]
MHAKALKTIALFVAPQFATPAREDATQQLYRKAPASFSYSPRTPAVNFGSRESRCRKRGGQTSITVFVAT